MTLKNGRIEQSNFHDVRVLRMNEAPLTRRAGPERIAATARDVVGGDRRRLAVPIGNAS